MVKPSDRDSDKSTEQLIFLDSIPGTNAFRGIHRWRSFRRLTVIPCRLLSLMAPGKTTISGGDSSGLRNAILAVQRLALLTVQLSRTRTTRLTSAIDRRLRQNQFLGSSGRNRSSNRNHSITGLRDSRPPRSSSSLAHPRKANRYNRYFSYGLQNLHFVQISRPRKGRADCFFCFYFAAVFYLASLRRRRRTPQKPSSRYAGSLQFRLAERQSPAQLSQPPRNMREEEPRLYKSSHNFYTFPCMSYKPHAFG